MVSSTLSSFAFVFLFSVCLVHSSPSLFGSGNVYVTFSLDSGYVNNHTYGATLYDLNLGYSIHVSYIDWNSFSDAIIETAINQTTGDAILLGKTVPVSHSSSNYYFTVDQVFVVLPGSTAQPFDAYFTASSSKATTANTGDSISITDIDLELGIAFLDQDWINFRITSGDAVVQGHVVPPSSSSASTTGRTLVADRVFISLPDQTILCPREDFVINCPNDEVATFTLTPNRCLELTNPPCTHQGPCPLFIPFCPPPYSLFSFPSQPNGCSTFYCFPSFVNLH